MLRVGPQLDERQVSILRKHHYRSGGKSLVEQLFLDQWWAYLVDLTPRWVAPNLLTLAGFAQLLPPLGYVLWASPSGYEKVGDPSLLFRFV